MVEPQNPVGHFVFGGLKGDVQLSCCCFPGGLFFAEPMRERRYVTMMDPFQIKYGNGLSGLLAVAPLMSEIIWVTSTLISLGNS